LAELILLHKEWVVEDFLGFDTVFGTLLQHFNDEVFVVFGNTSESEVVHVWLSFFDELESCFTILGLEWQLTTN
jgi:hypothetical protein